MNKNVTKKLALSLSMGIFVGLGIVITYAVNLTAISSTYNTGDTLSVTWFNDLKSKIGNIYGNGSSVGIGIASPSTTLDVNGSGMYREGLTVSNGGGASTLITMKDDESQNGQKHIHANSNLIGFLGGDGGWLDYFGADGNQWSRYYGDWYSNVFRRFNTWQYSHYSGTDGAEYATIFYDANDAGYYTDPNGTTRLNSLYPNAVYSSIYGRVDAPATFAGGYRYYLSIRSDERLKDNIKIIPNALEKIRTLKGVSYNLNEHAKEIGLEEGKKDIGLIAQDVEKVFPELVSIAKDGYKGLDYQHLLGPVIEAIKELADKFDFSQEKEKSQEERIKSLEEEVKELKELIKK